MQKMPNPKRSIVRQLVDDTIKWAEDAQRERIQARDELVQELRGLEKQIASAESEIANSQSGIDELKAFEES